MNAVRHDDTDLRAEVRNYLRENFLFGEEAPGSATRSPSSGATYSTRPDSSNSSPSSNPASACGSRIPR